MQIKFRNIFLKVIRNKYLLVFSIFILWLIFLDNNNLLVRKKLLNEAKQLEIDCEYYRHRIIKDSARLSELLKDSESLEKFAREQYLMKRDNEEIFIIMDK